MRLISIILLLVFCLSACNEPKDPPSDEPIPTVPNDPSDPVDPNPGPDPAPEPIPEPDPEPVPLPIDPAVSWDTHVTYFGSRATDVRRSKYNRARCVLDKVVALPEFKSKILNYDSPYTTNKFYDTTHTNAQVWQNIMEGDETLQPTVDNELDVEIEFYYAATSTVGYTYASSVRVWVNTKFFDTYATSSVAANLMHEWMHKLGYKHASTWSASRDHSVPYAIGTMVRSLGKQFEASCQ